MWFFVFCLFWVALTTNIPILRAFSGLGLFFIFCLFITIQSIGNVGSNTALTQLNSVFGISSLLFLSHMFVMTLPALNNNGMSFISNIVYLFSYSGGVFIILITLIAVNPSRTYFNVVSVFALALGCVVFFLIIGKKFSFSNENDVRNVGTNWALLSVSIFPFVFYIKKNKVRFFLTFLVIFSAILGNKRSVIVAIALSLIFIILYFLVVDRKKIKLKYAGWTIIVVSTIFASFVVLGDVYLSLYARMEDSVSDGGSGRVFIWLEVVKFLESSEWLRLIIGNGPKFYYFNINSSYSSAHNDFLEIFVSYGLFGILFYIAFLSRLLYLVLFNVIRRKELAPFAISLFVVFCVMSNLSGVFIYFSNYVLLIVGIVMLEVFSKPDRKKHQRSATTGRSSTLQDELSARPSVP
jgi:O-antigen ligase